MHKIEKKLKDFQKRLELNPLLKSHYLTVMRKIWESELMPEATLISLAKRVKPLIRLNKSMNSKCVDYERPSFLVWTAPEDLTQSFLFNFNKETSIIRNDDGSPLAVEGLEKVSEFPCYHRYGGYHRHGGYYGCLRPGVDEVIQQMPDYLWKDNQDEYAFELVFPSTDLFDIYDFFDIYDSVIDRHVSSVIVYKVTKGFPEKVRNQIVIYKEKEF